MALLAERLNPRDQVAIVVYAGAAGWSCLDLDTRRRGRGIKRLQAGGSTAGRRASARLQTSPGRT
jgi:hypothetical protein